MSKRIKLTENEIDKILEETRKKLEKEVADDGKINITQSLEKGNDEATIYFTTLAWAKMCHLIMGFDSEVGWHGIARKVGNVGCNYIIDDILVYPQDVSGVTVEMNDDYDLWSSKLSNEEFNNLRMQGHSHVNMGVTPSGTDTKGNKEILSAMADTDSFYIFMIWNKKLERNIKIYDMAENVLFENSDIDVKFWDFDSDEFMEDATQKVVKKEAALKREKKGNNKENLEGDVVDIDDVNMFENIYYDSDWDMFFCH